MASNIAFYGEKLFPKDKEPNLISYKYSGSDLSILYKHVFGKISQKIIDHWMPEWVA